MNKLVDAAHVKLAYRRYAAVYDRLFGAVFEPGRKEVVAEVNTKPAQRILEVGVGTGLSLGHYRPDAHVHGIDISGDMLDRARQRVARLGLSHVEALLEMDAQSMSYADDSFDAVVGMYVASVVPDPAQMLAEMRRVCVPGGDILIVNHFSSENPALRAFENALSPFASQIGFHPDFDLNELLNLAAIEVVEIKPVNLFGYWKLVRLRNVPVMVAASERSEVGAGYAEPASYKLREGSSAAR